MDLDKILNLALNKAFIGKDRIKQINSNEIADFVNKHLVAINYTRCCTELKDKKVFTFEEWLEVNYTQKGYIYLSKQAESAWYTIREVKKQYNIEYNL